VKRQTEPLAEKISFPFQKIFLNEKVLPCEDCQRLKDKMGRIIKANLSGKSNSSDILPVNCKFSWLHIFPFCAESQTRPQV